MNVETFVEKQKSLLNRFKDDWLKDNQKEPENYPLELDEYDDCGWIHQFDSYVSLMHDYDQGDL